MDAKIKKIWVTALKSGNYLQGHHRLHYTLGNEHYFCCLGVLWDLKGVGWEQSSSGATGVGYHTLGHEDKVGNLPLAFMAKVGLSPDQQATLTGLNDGGKSFQDIAVWIDKHL